MNTSKNRIGFDFAFVLTYYTLMCIISLPLPDNMFFKRGIYQMSSYTLNELIKKWTKEELTTEQAVGQVLLQVQTLSTRIGTLEKRSEQNRKENGKHTGK